MYARWTVTVLALGWLVAAAARAQPIPLGPQLDVSVGGSFSSYSDVAVADDGSFLVVWQDESDGSGYGVVGRAFAADETPHGAAFQVNAFTTAGQERPSVAARSDGGFVVAWESYDQDGQDDEIIGRRVGATGTPEGAEFHVNSHTPEAQRNAAVAADGNGGFVVVWDSYTQVTDDDSDDIFGQRFDGVGPVGSEFLVNAFTEQQQDEPAVAVWPGGGFVVVWAAANGYDNDHDGVLGQRFDADGNPAGGELQVHDAGYDVSVATHGGGFVVAFASFDYDVGVRRFDATGTPLGGPMSVGATAGGYPDVAADAAGDFLVVWGDAFADGSSVGVVARLFDATGTPVGGELVVNSYTTGYQGHPAVGANADGTFVVTWNGQGPSGSGIFARRLVVPSATSIGVLGTKLVVVDKLAAASKAKVVFVAKDQMSGITKGTGIDVDAISVFFTFGYGSVGGAFTLPAGASDGTQGWQVNSGRVAKFVNANAPDGVTGAKIGVIKPGRLLKLVGKTLGDAPIDLFAGGPPAGPIRVEYAITNGGQTLRHCTEFDPDAPGVILDFKEIAHGTGRKLVVRNGAPASCP